MIAADHFLIFNLLVWNEETGSTDHDRCVIDRLKIADCIEKDESCVKYSSTHTRGVMLWNTSSSVKNLLLLVWQWLRNLWSWYFCRYIFLVYEGLVLIRVYAQGDLLSVFCVRFLFSFLMILMKIGLTHWEYCYEWYATYKKVCCSLFVWNKYRVKQPDRKL